MRMYKLCAGLGAVFAALVVPMAATASAEVSGPCSGTIKGVDVATRNSAKPSDAILVTKTESVAVGATAAGTIDKYKIQMHFAGIAWTVGKGSADGNSWSKTVNVAPYARYGVGLYKVSGVSSGAANCTGAALVKVEGNALGTPAGLAGVALSGIGAVGVIAAGAKGWRPARKLVPPSFRSDAKDIDLGIDSAIRSVRTPQEYVNTVMEICRVMPEPMVVTALIHYVTVVNEPVVSMVCKWG